MPGLAFRGHSVTPAAASPNSTATNTCSCSLHGRASFSLSSGWSTSRAIRLKEAATTSWRGSSPCGHTTGRRWRRRNRDFRRDLHKGNVPDKGSGLMGPYGLTGHLRPFRPIQKLGNILLQPSFLFPAVSRAPTSGTAVGEAGDRLCASLPAISFRRWWMHLKEISPERCFSSYS